MDTSACSYPIPALQILGQQATATASPRIQPFDIPDLPDELGQAQAIWLLQALSHTLAVGNAYITLLDPPDRKGAWDLECAAKYLERAIRRAFPAEHAEWLITLAVQKAREGVAAQRAMEAQASQNHREDP